jgi:hypothetical protein
MRPTCPSWVLPPHGLTPASVPSFRPADRHRFTTPDPLPGGTALRSTACRSRERPLSLERNLPSQGFSPSPASPVRGPRTAGRTGLATLDLGCPTSLAGPWHPLRDLQPPAGAGRADRVGDLLGVRSRPRRRRFYYPRPGGSKEKNDRRSGEIFGPWFRVVACRYFGHRLHTGCRQGMWTCAGVVTDAACEHGDPRERPPAAGLRLWTIARARPARVRERMRPQSRAGRPLPRSGARESAPRARFRDP